MKPKPFKHWNWHLGGRRLCITAVFLYAFIHLAACEGNTSSTGGVNPTETETQKEEEGIPPNASIEAFCQTQRQQFHEGVWAPLLVNNCQGCHNTSGMAVLDAKLSFQLFPEAYANAAQKNLDAFTALTREHGAFYVLAKVSNEIPHGGGRIFAKDSAEYAKLQNFLAQLENTAPDNKGAAAPSCTHTVARMDSRLSAVRLLSPRATFRKAALNIAGRVPTEEEDALLAQVPEQLGELLNALLEEEAFYERLKEIFNDIFVFSVRGQSGFSYNFFQAKDATRDQVANPYSLTFYEDYPDIHSKLRLGNGIGSNISLSLWEEPLALIAYIARNNRPFTEILTANYAVVNDYTAFAYNLEQEAPAVGTPINNWRPATLWQRKGTPTETIIPSAGVLSTAAFLSKFPTNTVNFSRGRAEFVSRNFLATHILSFAQRPVNSTQLDSTDNPTLNNPACAACHVYMDGLAGTFSGYSFGYRASYQPKLTTWNDQKFLPSFQGEYFPQRTTSNHHRMPWMTQRMAADPRFPYAMVLRVFEGITGRKVLAYPTDTTQPNHAKLLSAWESQNAFLHEVATRMAQQGMNVKVAFRDILQSPYFRAEQDPNLPADLALSLGEGRLLTPEMLARKIRATLGVHWGEFSSSLPVDKLTGVYNILYGGIHPTSSPARLTQLNSLMVAVASGMARELGCRIPAWEFSKPLDKRTLLTKAKQETVPMDSYSEGMKANPENERVIRENLAYLHQRLLGEFVSPNSPEVDLSYELFVEAWKERPEWKGPAVNAINHPDCRGVWDLTRASGNARVQWPAEQQVTTDTNSTIYAWQAVLTYLLMDFRFLYE